MIDEIKKLCIWPKNEENWLFKDQYLIPLYQRPYAWKFENEISRLLDDIKGIDRDHCEHYRLGILSVIGKVEQGKKKYEVVDGQQRLTTLYLLLKALSDSNLLKDDDKKVFEGAKENLIFENRKNSTDTLKDPEKEGADKDVDPDIRTGFEGIRAWIDKHSKEEIESFLKCLKKVSVYRVPLPEKTDPCKYFIRMNARGKQLEPVDVIKARLMSRLTVEDQIFFGYIWEACSRMDRYIQKTIDTEFCDEIFKNWKDGLPWTDEQKNKLKKCTERDVNSSNDDSNKKSIINFPTFLMHVLKLCALNKNKEVVAATDDKRLIKYFEGNWGCAFCVSKESKSSFKDWTSLEVREFLYTLLHARYLFDGWIVRGEQEDETGWVIQHLKKNENGDLEPVGSFELSNEKELRGYEKTKTSEKIKMLQSCLRVTYSSPSSMIWITKLLKKLWDLSYIGFRGKDPNNYGVEVLGFLEEYSCKRVAEELKGVEDYKEYEDVSQGTATPRILFNFLDYLLWRDREWVEDLTKDNDVDTVKKGLNNFKFSYLSSVEHWYPQNPEDGKSWEKVDQFGNLFLIGGGENSSLSNASFTKKEPKIKDWVEKGSNISLKGLHMYAKTLGEEDWKNTDCEKLGREHYEKLKNEIKAWNLGRGPSKLS